MYKRGNVKIKRIISDLRDAIVDSKKVDLFEYEMLLIRKKRETLNTQNDSIPAKLCI